MQVVSYYFNRLILLPYYFFCSKAPMQHIFVSFFSAFCSKIEKNMPIFCNFFSLCINDLREI